MIKEESHDRDFLFSHADAGPHSLSVRVRNIRLIPSLEYDSSIADILSDRSERVSAKKGPPPGHSGLKFWLVTILRATRSLRSLKQALRLTPPARISPFGHRPPFQWAGSCTSARLFVFRRGDGRHISKRFCALRAVSNAVLTVKYAGAAPHPSRGFPACPWKFCVAASRLPCAFLSASFVTDSHSSQFFLHKCCEFSRFLSAKKKFFSLVGARHPPPRGPAFGQRFCSA